MTILPDQDAFRPLAGAEKVAAVLLALDRETSSRILKHFDQQELKRIARITAQLGAVSCATLEELCGLLVEEIDNREPDFSGGETVAEELLAGALPDEQVADIMADVWGRSNKFVWRRVAQLSEKIVADFLAAEHPQTVAIVLGRLDPAVAAQILAQLPRETRSQAMRRMLVMKPVSDAILHFIEEGLQEVLFSTSQGPSTAEVSARVASIVNQLERDQIAEIVSGISAAEPLLAVQLQSLIFSFEDIVGLSQRARLIIFDQASTEAVVLALWGTGVEMREAVLPCLSARTRRMVESELASPAEPPRRNVLAAQREIANLVLRLSEQGLIDLAAERAPAGDAEPPSGV